MTPEAAGLGSKAPLNIFLSYAPTDARELADRLVTDLKARGYDVWRDREDTRAGFDWRDDITDGLRQAAVVVAVMTPRAVRLRSDATNETRDDSVCLNEIAYAVYHRIPVVPVMAVACEPPFAILHLAYVDLMKWSESDATYRDGLGRLAKDIESARRREFRYRTWYTGLKPWDFERYLADRRRDFCGRTWLFRELDEWLRAEVPERALIITGDPGTGKTAIVAELVHQNPNGRMLAYHCCEWETQATLDPALLVRSVAAMIAGKLPEYAAQLDDPQVRQALSAEDPGTALERGVLIPLASLPARTEVRYLLVDALDEALAWRGPTESIVKLLATHTDRFPPWLRLVATTRTEAQVMTRLKGLPHRELETQDHRNLADLDAYIRVRLAAKALRDVVEASGRTSDEVVHVLADKSEGLFLYVRQALDGIERGILRLDGLEALPPGMAGLYETYFDRLFADAASYESTRAMLEVVVAAQRPLTLEELARATGLDPIEQLPPVLTRLATFIPARTGSDGQRAYAAFHKSLADWLTGGEPEYRSPYWISERAGHRRLADTGWDAYRSDVKSMSAYTLRALPVHLFEAGETDRLRDLARDVVFLEAQARLFADDPLLPLTTLELALRAAAVADDPVRIVEFLFALAERREATRQESPLEVCRAGSMDRAQRLLELIGGEHALLWGLLIASELQDHDETAQAQSMMQRLLAHRVTPLNTSGWQAQYAAELLADLVDVERAAFDELQQRLFPKGYRHLYDVLVAAGKVDVALESARRFSKGDYEGLVRGRARERLAAGAFADAWSYADLLPDRDQSVVGREIVVAQAEAGQLAEARRIVDPWQAWYRALALGEMAQAPGQRGDTELAENLFEAARGAAGEVESERERLLGLIAVRRARWGDLTETRVLLNEACAAARQESDAHRRDWQLQSLVESIATIGDFTAARELATEIDDRWVQGFACFAIARELATRGDVDAAFELFAGTDAEAHAQGLLALGEMLVEKGDLTSALAAARRLDESTRDRLLRSVAGALGERGELAEALDVARSIGDPDERGAALSVVAFYTAKAGDVPAARHLAQQIESYSARIGALYDLATLTAEAGDFATARAIADAMPRDTIAHGREHALRSVAAFQRQAGRRDEYRTVLASALTSAHPVPARRNSNAVLRGLAVHRAKAADSVQARAVVELISDPSERRGALRDVSNALAEAGLGRAPVETASPTPHVTDRAEGPEVVSSPDGAGDETLVRRMLKRAVDLVQHFTGIARAVAHGRGTPPEHELDDDAAARDALRLAADRARTLEPPEYRLYVLQDVAVAQLAAGQRDSAIQTFDHAISTVFQLPVSEAIWAPRRLAKLLGEHGLVDLAQQMAGRMPGWMRPQSVFEELVNGLLVKRDYAAALEIARGLTSSQQASAMRAIARAQAEDRQFVDALATAEMLKTDSREYELALADVAQVQANLGFVADAQTTLASIAHPFRRACVLARIAVTQAANGERVAARATVTAALKEAQTPESRGNLAGGFRHIVDAQLALGDCEGAIDTARSIDWDRERAEALAEIAVAFVKRGSPDMACEIVEQSLQGFGRSIGRVGAALAEAGYRQALKGLLVRASDTLDMAQDFAVVLGRAYPDDAMRLAEAITSRVPDR